MLAEPPIGPALASSRSIMLPASFAACGLLLFVLLVSLVGCGGEPFRPGGQGDRTGPQPIRCSCWCEYSHDPAAPSQILIAAGEDDAVQGSMQATAVLTANQLELGLNNSVGLRFQLVGIPKGALITSAVIQFTAVQVATEPTSLSIRVVPNAAPFTTSTDLTALTGATASSLWTPGDWAVDEAGTNEQTPDLTDLLKPIVQDPQYKPDSAVAFIITGSGHRVARSFEAALPLAPFLEVKYQAKQTKQDFLTCGLPGSACGQSLWSALSQIATVCNVGDYCQCDDGPPPPPNTSSTLCDTPCPPLGFGDCDTDGIVKTPANQALVCVPTFGP